MNLYSIERPLFGQWEYVDGIGADAFNSEVDSYDSQEVDENVQDKWYKVHKTFHVWQMKKRYFSNVVLQDPALSAVGPFLFGEDTEEE